MPEREYVALFIKTVDDFYAPLYPTDDNPIDIAVHCHYAFNRTGFMICCYLIERAGYTVSDALASVCCPPTLCTIVTPPRPCLSW